MAMKRIGILTLNGYYNYGNRLQNYALQEVLKSLSFYVETILVDRNTANQERFTERLYNLRRNSPIQIYYKIYNRCLRYIYKDAIKKRTTIFKKFTSEYIQETNYSISRNYIPEDLSNQYDYFITGSDQVWNPSSLGGSSIYFLTFAEKQKRIAYAPSFGVSQIESEYIENYRKWISGMHKLSVRETDGARIIKELTGREAPVLVDPTMLLTGEKWLSIAKEAHNKPKGKYLLTYFLGGIPRKYIGHIKNIVKDNKLEVINLAVISEKDTYITGPNEFIDYINSCSVFCTDSFHGVVFSMLLEKPFIIYKRNESSTPTFSRIDTLLDKFNLNSRRAENIKTTEEIFHIDYSHLPPILEAERKKSLDYLKESLNVKDEN